ncbi:MAG: hypothetical protein ACO2Z9_09380 [Crocinitomicaceae bacterium]
MRLSIVLFASLIMMSCTKDKTMDAECETPISFSQEVMPMLQTNCVGCHNGSQPPNLTTHASVSVAADNVLARISLNEGDALLMPLGGPRFHQDSIRKIKCWIEQGKLDN